MAERKYYIDNIRWVTVLLLFPFHSFIIYNNFGEGNYIKGAGNSILTNITTSFWPWFMPLLFVLAGISSFYSLKDRTAKYFVIERLRKLFIPLVFGILLICPCLTYFAECFHNGFTGTYFQQYILFFTKNTDLTGYNGGFTPGHLWFILYLSIISLISLPLIIIIPRDKIAASIEKTNIFSVLSLVIFPLLGQFILNIYGKSIGEYFFYYLIGYFVMSEEEIINKCIKHIFFLGILSIISVIIYMLNFNFFKTGFIALFFGKFYAFCSILLILGLGKKYFNYTNNIARYFSGTSFGVYLFHLPWITILAYFFVRSSQNIYVQAILIMALSIPCTFISIEAARRFYITRFMFCLINIPRRKQRGMLFS